jgi:hypothetical protein
MPDSEKDFYERCRTEDSKAMTTLQEQLAHLRSLKDGWDDDPREREPAPAPTPKVIEDAERVALALEASGFKDVTVSADVLGGVWLGVSRGWIIFRNKGTRIACG